MQLTPRLEKAIGVAITIHAGQKRKGDNITPYAVHPISVAMLLSQYTEDEDIIIAGLLHDAIEDTLYKEKEITRDFGEKVARIVAEVSEKDTDALWEKRKVGYLNTIKHKSREACLVTCADKICNLRALGGALLKLGESVWSNFSRSKEKKLWYYRSVYAELKKRFRHGLIRELHRALKEMETGVPTPRWKKTRNYIGPFDVVRHDHFVFKESIDLTFLVGTYHNLGEASRRATHMTKEAKEELLREKPLGYNEKEGNRWDDGCTFGVYDSTGKIAYWPSWEKL